jgi:uncharacterized membrane protein YgdD (TMEM256/DUF423 family)
MNSQPLAKRSISIGALLLALAVLIGAFGAHGLKSMVDAEKLATFETGVRYHFYHGLGLVLIGLYQQLYPSMKILGSMLCFVVGTLLFSFNCYFYVLSGVKVFAMIVPLGGVLFVVGWALFFFNALKLKDA